MQAWLMCITWGVALYFPAFYHPHRPHRGVWPDPYGSLGILGNQRGAGAVVQNAHVPVSEAVPILQGVSVLQYWVNAGRVCEAAAAYPLADGENGRQGCRTVSQ
jgi:hypothetical protein